MSKITKTPLWPPIPRPKSQHFSEMLLILLISGAFLACEAEAAPDSSQQQILFYPRPHAEPQYGTADEIRKIRAMQTEAQLEAFRNGVDNWSDAKRETVAKRIQQSQEGGSHVR